MLPPIMADLAVDGYPLQLGQPCNSASNPVHFFRRSQKITQSLSNKQFIHSKVTQILFTRIPELLETGKNTYKREEYRQGTNKNGTMQDDGRRENAYNNNVGEEMGIVDGKWRRKKPKRHR